MSILADWQIRDMALAGGIVPFEEAGDRPGVISYGLTSYGYDVRIGYEFKVFTNANGALIDPKKFDPAAYMTADLRPRNRAGDLVTVEMANEGYYPLTRDDFVIIPPNGCVLGETIERFRIPRGCLVAVLGKSTYARCGLVVNVTPLEPEWEGTVTVELSNTTPLPVKVYCGEGIAQFVFHTAADPARQCEISYRDKRGKYQNQSGVTNPIVKGV
ncbi:MAG: dCTP deaminase [Fimbriiglobus sp.]